MLRDYQQFPTTDGNVEARRRTRPAWREAVPASIDSGDSGAFFPIAATSTMRGAVGRRLCVAPGALVCMVPMSFLIDNFVFDNMRRHRACEERLAAGLA